MTPQPPSTGPIRAEAAQRDHERGQALVLGHLGVAAGEHEDVGGPVGGACEHFLPVDKPSVAVTLGPGLGRRDVRARVGFGVAKHDDDLAAQRPADELALLLFRRRVQQRVADHLGGSPAVHVQARGGDLLEQRGSHVRVVGRAAVLGRPAGAEPALPGDQRVQLRGVVAARHALLLGPLRVDVLGHPVTGILAILGEPVVFGEVHLYSSFSCSSLASG
jgi:hypothetical protein